MITLTGQREISGCQVYQDDVDALAWYAIPNSPHIALDDRGTPIFSLVWYRRPLDSLTEEERRTKLGGGLLTFSADLALSAAQQSEIRRTVSADPALHDRLAAGPGDTGGPDYRSLWAGELGGDPTKLAAALKLGNLPVRDGTVTIAVLGEDPDHAGDFLANLVGGGPVVSANERAAFMAKLTQDGAVLLWDMVAANLPAIRVGYDLKFDHRLTGVQMTVWCDAKKAYDAVQKQWDRIQDNASWSVTHDDGGTHYTYSHDEDADIGDRMRIVAVDSEAAGVSIVPEAGADAVKEDTIAQLMETGFEMIKDFLATTFLEFKAGENFKANDDPDLKTELAEQDGKKYGHDGIDYSRLKDWHEELDASLNFTVKTKAVLEGRISPNDNLANVLQGHAVDTLRRRIDLDASWYRFLDVTAICTADFDHDPVDLVKVHLSYHAAASAGVGDGHPVDTEADLEFVKGSQPQHFTTYLAGPDKTRYTYDYKVFYGGGDAKFDVHGETSDTILVLDTDRLGILRVGLQAGLIDWTRLTSAVVKLSYGAGADRHEAEYVLNSGKQSDTWVEVIAKEVTEPYGYQVTFVDTSGQRLELPAATSRAKTLVIDQPIQESLEVVVVPAGSFGAGGLLSQVVVALRYQDTANNYRVDDTVTLAKEGDSKTWAVPLVDKNLRTYQYRTTVFYSDGVTREDEWQTTDKAVLAVGDPFGMRVKILPNLLKTPGGVWLFGTIHLSFDDGSIHAEKDLPITDFTTALDWRFRLAAPDRHTYHYQLTLFKADGTQVALPDATDSREVLILKPPAP